MQTITSAQMKALEKQADANGLSYTQMMYNAGSAAADYILKNTPQPAGKIALILAGRGNNGGDGYVAARKLQEAGFSVLVLMTEGTPKTEDAFRYFAGCREAGIELLCFEAGRSDILFSGADVIVDALYGTGFHGRLSDTARAVTRLANNSGARIYALDLPSGLNADTGEADPDAIHAHATIAFHLPKPAHAIPAAQTLCGTLHCADIGIPYV